MISRSFPRRERVFGGRDLRRESRSGSDVEKKGVYVAAGSAPASDSRAIIGLGGLLRLMAAFSRRDHFPLRQSAYTRSRGHLMADRFGLARER